MFLEEDKIPLSQWVGIDQWYGSLDCAKAEETHPAYRLAATLNEPEALQTKEVLTKYDSLLHHTRIHHGVLEHLVPQSTNGSLAAQACKTLLAGLPLSFIRFIAFIPPLLFYLLVSFFPEALAPEMDRNQAGNTLTHTIGAAMAYVDSEDRSQHLELKVMNVHCTRTSNSSNPRTWTSTGYCPGAAQET